MLRWFFANDEIFCKDPTPSPTSPSLTPKTSSTPLSVSHTDWTFKVKFDGELCSNESLAICGSCSSLGKWDVQSSLPLTQSEDSTIWTVKVALPLGDDVNYRYLVCALSCSGQKIVRFWETHIEGRLISCGLLVQDDAAVECETFGILNNKLKIERGWLSPATNVIQLKFLRSSLLLKTPHDRLLLRAKITPIKIKADKKCMKLKSPIEISSGALAQPQDSYANKQEDQNQTFAFCEVASLQAENAEFHKQPKFGTPCGPDHLLIFNLSVDDIEHTAYLIDLYEHAPKSGADVPPSHFGYQYVSPQDLKKSEGTLQLLIMCANKHRPIGTMKCNYLVVTPLPSYDFNLEKTFQRHWNPKHETLYIGHRGCGNSFRFHDNIVRENTLYSLSLAAEHGADMVEIDVQLTKDMIPVLWHDFHLFVTNDLNADAQENDIMHLRLTKEEIQKLKSSEHRVEKNLLGFPLNRFTLEQLRRVKVHEQPPKETICDTGSQNNRPFVTLEQVLKEIDDKVGFLIEVKWPQLLTKNSKRESLLPEFSKNEFVDAILQVVLKFAASRQIIFASFDADICTIVRLKQNLYPTLFLILPSTSETKFLDPRSQFISTGIQFCTAMELLGVAVNCSDLLAMPGKVSFIQKKSLSVFCWGEEGRFEENRNYLKVLGVNAIIYDRINHAVEPMDVKKTIFYIVMIKNIFDNM